eukprot:g3421.t1
MSSGLSPSVPIDKLAKPLVEAAAAGNAKVFKALVEAGADVTALVEGGAGIEALVEAGEDKKEQKGCTLLHTAVHGGSEEVLSAVLEAGADVNERDPSSDRSALCQALSPWRGKEEVARRLVVAGADVNYNNPLSLAVSKNYERLAEDLLLKGADPNEGSPLACAASRGLDGTASNLLRHGADKDKLDSSGDSPLILASKAGHLSTVEVLLEAGADVNIIGASASALGAAAEYGYTEVMEAIIGRGAEVNAAFDDGSTALHRAARNSEPDAVDALIKAGAKTEIVGYPDDNLTPLLVAAAQDAFETMCALLRHGADPNATDSLGNTALHMICTSPKAGFETAVNELLLQGADKTMRDPDGCTPAGNLDVRGDIFAMDDEEEKAPADEIHRVRMKLQTSGPSTDRTKRTRYI